MPLRRSCSEVFAAGALVLFLAVGAFAFAPPPVAVAEPDGRAETAGIATGARKGGLVVFVECSGTRPLSMFLTSSCSRLNRRFGPIMFLPGWSRR